MTKHAQGTHAATPEGSVVPTHSPGVSVYARMMRTGRAIGARTLGDLKGDDGETGSGGEYAKGVRVTHARCTCWCERSIIEVTWDEIVEGVTHSCGTPRCDRLDEIEAVRRRARS